MMILNHYLKTAGLNMLELIQFRDRVFTEVMSGPMTCDNAKSLDKGRVQIKFQLTSSDG